MTTLLTHFTTAEPDTEARLRAFLARRREETGADVAERVREIIHAVRDRGDAALVEYCARFDALDISADALPVSIEERDRTADLCPENVREALSIAARRIRDYHKRQMPQSWQYQDEHGNTLGMRWQPVEAAGIYVPGGTAAYPSSVLMNALPAQAAGVERIAMTVPTPQGILNAAVMEAARQAGITEIYRTGGAQAIAALAYGTDSIAPVQVIAGPGNAYVAEAKRQLFGTVGIDMIAGPSEIAVIADGSVEAEWIAADLLSQAEHDPMSQSILITDDNDYADKVIAAIETTLTDLPRRELALTSLQRFGAVVMTNDMDEACRISNLIAPEHLELAVSAPDILLPKLSRAGAIFMGSHTPEAIGDYVAGPSHVLPTTQSAAFASGLSVYHFLTKTSLIGCSPDGFTALAQPTATLAEAEGLHAHGLSISRRVKS